MLCSIIDSFFSISKAHMQAFEKFLRSVAIVFVVIVVATWPLAFLLHDMGEAIFSPGTLRQLIRETFLQGDFSATVAEQVVAEVAESADEDGGIGALVQSALGNLDEEQWEQIVDLIAPPTLIAETLDELVDDIYSWIDSDQALPDLLIDLQPWIQNLSANLPVVTEKILNSLPACTLVDLAELMVEGVAGEIENLPLCLPPEPLYSLVVDASAQVLPEQLGDMSATIDLTEVIAGCSGFGIEAQSLLEVKIWVRQVRWLAQWGWVAVLGLFLVSIPMGARSFLGALKWGGWSLALAGALTLLLGGLVYMFSDVFLGGLLQLALPEVPAALTTPLSAISTKIVSLVTGPLFVQGGILFGLGALALLVGLLLGQSAKRAA
jgi:hypothetical protein